MGPISSYSHWANDISGLVEQPRVHFHVLLEKRRDLWKELEGDASNANGSCPSQLQLKAEAREMWTQESGVLRDMSFTM